MCPLLTMGLKGSHSAIPGAPGQMTHHYDMASPPPSGTSTTATHVSQAVSETIVGHRTWSAQERWDAFEMWRMVISPTDDIPTLNMDQVTPTIINFMAVMDRGDASNSSVAQLRKMVLEAATLPTSGAPAPAGLTSLGADASGPGGIAGAVASAASHAAAGTVPPPGETIKDLD